MKNLEQLRYFQQLKDGILTEKVFVVRYVAAAGQTLL